MLLTLLLLLGCPAKLEVPLGDCVPSNWYADTDADGFGDGATAATACEPPSGFVVDGTDCDDANASVHPDADEICDTLDNDCDSLVEGQDDSLVDAPTWYADNDGDGFGGEATADRACQAPTGTLAESDDCDDADASVHPGADEVCDGLDNDCDGLIDTQDDAADGGVVEAATWYTDADSDRYGDPDAPQQACEAPPGTVANDTDCDDGESSVNPGASEVCDGLDNDCDGLRDGQDDGVEGAPTWYTDSDGDGYGDASSTQTGCSEPPGAVASDDDCDDGAYGVNPGASEVCDGVDNDCDGLRDGQDDSVVDAATWYTDDDGDGFGDPASTQIGCNEPPGAVASDDDCDDTDAAVSPAATELCNSADDDCDGLTDADDPDATCDGGCAAVDLSDAAWADCTCATYGAHDYVYCDTGATWADAQATCETVDAHLVVIDDAAEDAWVYDSLLAIHATKWWIGLADLGHTGTFEWVYPQSSGYTNWRSGEPSGAEYCVHHWYEWDPFAWNDEQCTDSKRWICEFEGTSGADAEDTGAADSGDTGAADSGDTGAADSGDTGAVTACGSAFYCLDLSAQVNRDHTNGPWTDDPSESFDVPPGVQSWVVADGSTVDFVIIDPDENGGASLALTRGGESYRPSYSFPETFTFDGGGASGATMYVAGLASGWSDPSSFTGIAATLTITFVDGTSQLVELANGVNLDDWNHTSHSVSDADAVRVYEDTTYGRHIDALSIALASPAEIDTIVWLDDSTVHTGTAQKTSVAIFAITVGG